METMNFTDKVKQIYLQNGVNSDSKYRLDARNYIENNNLPTAKHENWKYINLAILNKYNFEINNKYSLPDGFLADNYIVKDIESYNIFIINGIINYELSNIPKDIILNHIDNNANIGSIDDDRQTYFSQLNTAIFLNGIFIEINKNIHLDMPIHIIHILDCSENESFINTRRIFKYGANSDATIIESFFKFGENKVLYNSVAEIFIEENSNCHHIKIQQDKKIDFLIDFVQANQQKYSNYVNFTFTDAGKFVRNNLNSKLNDENIETHFLGVFIGDNNNLIDNHTFVDHANPNCFSNENYRGILFDSSTGIFNGKILVRPDAQKTNAYQSNKNILASKDATINTKPELEIYADDVKCSHGATSGALDKSSLFYLRARGIDEKRAESLLMNAFVAEVIEELKNQQVKDYLFKITRNKLNEDMHFIVDDDIVNINNI